MNRRSDPETAVHAAPRAPAQTSVFEEALCCFVGGVNSPVRGFKAVGGRPVVLKRGEGAFVWDEFDRRYVDHCLGWGALLTGHAHPSVVKAVEERAKAGVVLGTTTEEEVRLAQRIQRHFPSMEKIRFVNSGTEAAMSALRLARGITKRDIVVKFDGCYHGHADGLLVRAGSGVGALPQASSAGVPERMAALTLSLPYNDSAVARDVFQKRGHEIAAVIVEPVAGNMGVVPARREFLETLRNLTRRYGSLLIFDEIITGYRSGCGGVQTTWGIEPDLTCLGKIIGGGFPVGAYGGREQWMRHLAPEGEVYQAGTFSGNPVIMAAGAAVLDVIEEADVSALVQNVQRFADEMNGFFRREGLSARLQTYGTMFSLFFTTQPVEDFEQAQVACAPKSYTALYRRLLQAGVFWPPAPLEACFVSIAHDESCLNHLADTLRGFFKKDV